MVRNRLALLALAACFASIWAGIAMGVRLVIGTPQDRGLAETSHNLSRGSAPAADQVVRHERSTPSTENATIRVQVIEEKSGLPIPMGAVRIHSLEPKEGAFSQDVVLDDQGSCRVSVPATLSSYSITPLNPSDGNSITVGALLPGASIDRSVFVSVEHLEHITIVAQAPTGEPIDTARLLIEDVGAPIESEGAGITMPATPDGSISLWLSDEDKSGRMTAPGYETIWLDLSRISRGGRSVLMLYPEAKVRVSLLNSGTPMLGKPISMRYCLRTFPPSTTNADPRSKYNSKAITDENGCCLFEGLPPYVNLELLVNREGGSMLPEPRFSVASGDEKQVQIDVGKRVTLAGRLIRSNGCGVPDVQVICLMSDSVMPRYALPEEAVAGGRRLATARTDGEGCFRIDGLTSGVWCVGPAALQPVEHKASDGIAPYLYPLYIDGIRSTETVEVPVFEGLFIRGEVSSSLSAGSILVKAYGEGIAGPLITTCHGDGTFLLGPVAPVGHRIQAFMPEDAALVSEYVLAEPGDSHADLILTEPDTVEVYVVSSNDQAAQAQLYWLVNNRGRWQLESNPLALTSSTQVRCRPNRTSPEGSVLIAVTANGEVAVASGFSCQEKKLNMASTKAGVLTVRCEASSAGMGGWEYIALRNSSPIGYGRGEEGIDCNIYVPQGDVDLLCRSIGSGIELPMIRCKVYEAANSAGSTIVVRDR